MKLFIHTLQLLSLLTALLIYNTAYSQNTKASDFTIIKISAALTQAINTSLDSNADVFSFMPKALNAFALPKPFKKLTDSVALSEIYHNIEPKYKNTIQALGLDSLQVSFLSSDFVEVKFLKHLQILIIKSKKINKKVLQQLSDIQAIQKDYYFSLYNNHLKNNKKWQVASKRLQKALDFKTATNLRTLDINENKKPLWSLDAIQARTAWTNHQTQGQDVKILVADSGVDVQHPAFENRIEDYKNFVSKENNNDVVGHGTHVSSIILGDRYGVAPRAKLLVAKVCNVQGCFAATILSALNWAIDKKVDIINLSLGGVSTRKQTLFEQQAFQAVADKGIIVVAASGNFGQQVKNKIGSPANYHSVISVGSVKYQNGAFTKSLFSQYSTQLDIMAPGENIMAAVPRFSQTQKLTLYYLDKKTSQQGSAVLFSRLATKEQAGNLASIPKADLAMNTDEYITNKMALIVVDPKLDNKKTLLKKLESIKRRGASSLLIYLPNKTLHSVFLKNQFTLPYLMISQDFSNQLAKALKAKKMILSLELSLSKANISYYTQTGTSMAAPHVSGVLGLAKSLNKNLDFKDLRLLLATSKKVLKQNPSPENKAGLVQANDLLSLVPEL